MTGTERLRRLIHDMRRLDLWTALRCGVEPKYDTLELDGKTLNQLLDDIAGQIEREQVCDHGTVSRVVAEMERHFLGHEGMDDSPVARWARELWAALGGHVEEVADVATIRKDAYDAYEWVEAHGGLDAMVELSSRLMTVDALRAAIEETCTRIGVEHTGDLMQDAQAIWQEIEALRSRLKESVPRAAYERHLARRQRQIYESHAALRRRNERIAELERERDELREMVRQLNAKTDDMEKRLMPEGMEWPRFEDGEKFAPGDDGSVEFFGDGIVNVWINGDHQHLTRGERVKRPAPEDSWERLEEDAVKGTCEYFGSKHCDCSTCQRLERSVKDCGMAKATDLVRRARALAGGA